MDAMTPEERRAVLQADGVSETLLEALQDSGGTYEAVLDEADARETRDVYLVFVWFRLDPNTVDVAA